MNIAQKIIEAHKLKFGSLPPLQQCSVSSALFNADCMDILPLIPDKSVQLILADLPYGTTNERAIKWSFRFRSNAFHFLRRMVVVPTVSFHEVGRCATDNSEP